MLEAKKILSKPIQIPELTVRRYEEIKISRSPVNPEEWEVEIRYSEGYSEADRTVPVNINKFEKVWGEEASQLLDTKPESLEESVFDCLVNVIDEKFFGKEKELVEI